MVRLEMGTDVRVPAAAAPERGERAWVVVRPDQMSLASAAPTSSDLNVIPGTVKKVSFLGTHLQYTVAIFEGAELTVVEALSTRNREAAVPKVDGELHVTWPASVSLCFKEGKD